MNKFIAMIILKPDIKEKRINNVQSCILNMFEQNTKVRKVWYLGRQKLDFKNKKYSEGIYLKLDILARPKKNRTNKTRIKEKSRYFIIYYYE